MPVELAPVDLQQLSDALANANASGGKVSHVDLGRLNRILEHTPEDMTVTVEAGITLTELQSQLGKHGQWIPIDPPHQERTRISDLLATNASGPRRYGFGTVRDYVIGLRVAFADGTIIKSGGKVVKNVAGYDLAKLFIGSQGTLGVIVEATFKSRPRPEREAFVQQSFADLADAIRLVDAVESKLNPVVLDLHNLTHTDESSRKQFSMVLGFAGAREDVECELTRAAELGTASEGNLEHENIFWSTDSSEPTHKQSVLPSKLTHLLRELGPVPFVARAGNGIVHYRGGPVPPRAMLPRHLFQRVKDTFDPKHLFPSLPQ